MKKPTAAVYLRPNKAKTKAAVNVRYTYNRESFPIPLGVTINVADWDVRMQRVDFEAAGSVQVNGKIKEAIATLESISNKLIEAGNAPTVDVVRAAYKSFIQETAKKQELKFNRVKDEAYRISERYSKVGGSYYKTLQEFKRLEAELNAKAQTLIEVNSMVLDKSAEVGSFIDKVPSYTFRNFTEALSIARSISDAITSTPEKETESESPARKQFHALLEEYIEERTGVSLNATREEVRAVKRATTGTNKGLRSWAKALKGFTESKHVKRANLEISIGNLSQKFYDTYAAYLMDSDGHNLYNNSFGGHVKKLKTFLKWVELDRQLAVDRRYLRFKVLTEEKEIVKLSMTEIDLLYTFDPDSDPDLARVHGDANSWRKYIDFTVFSFLTSLRISDIKRVKGFRIENGYIQGRTKKTNGNFKIPLNLDPRIMEILERYGRDMRLFSDVEYNRQIKKLLKMFLERHALYQQPLTIRRFKHTEPEPIETPHYFYELYTSHCNRKGWVSQMSDRGFDDFTLMEMMGTKSHQEFLKYKKNKVTHLEEKVRQVLGTL